MEDRIKEQSIKTREQEEEGNNLRSETYIRFRSRRNAAWMAGAAGLVGTIATGQVGVMTAAPTSRLLIISRSRNLFKEERDRASALPNVPVGAFKVFTDVPTYVRTPMPQFDVVRPNRIFEHGLAAHLPIYMTLMRASSARQGRFIAWGGCDSCKPR